MHSKGVHGQEFLCVGIVLGSISDISSLVEYDFCQPVWYYDAGDFPEPRRHMAHWLGEAMHIGQSMCNHILPVSGVPIVRSSAMPVSEAEMMSEEVKQELLELNTAIISKLGNNKDDSVDVPDYFSEIEDDQDLDIFTPKFDPMEEEYPEHEPEILDQYLSLQVQLPLGDDIELGTVIACKRMHMVTQ